MYRLATAPQSIGGVLDSGFRLYKTCLKHTYVLAVAAALAAAPVNRAARVLEADPQSMGAVGVIMIGVLFAIVVSVVFYGAITSRIAEISEGSVPSAGASLGTGWRRGPALFGAYLCYGIAVLIGLLLLIVPGLYLMVTFAFAPFAAVIERKGPVESLFYSRDLVRGHWWRTAGLVTVIGIILVAVTMLLSIVSTVPLLMNPDMILDPGIFPWYVDYLVSPLLSGVFTPLWIALFLAVFQDLKLRHEGGDIAARIAAADA